MLAMTAEALPAHSAAEPLESPGWTRCRAFLKAQGLPQPVLPGGIANAMRPVSEGFCATPGWMGELSLDDSIAEWVQGPLATRAWLGVHGHGVQSHSFSLALGTPQVGVFLRQRWRQDLTAEWGDFARIEGAFSLLTALLEHVHAVRVRGAWPPGRRLLLVDDAWSVARWAWIERPGDALVHEGPLAWMQALMALDRLSSGASDASNA